MFEDDCDPLKEWPEANAKRLIAIMPQVEAYRAGLVKEGK